MDLLSGLFAAKLANSETIAREGLWMATDLIFV